MPPSSDPEADRAARAAADAYLRGIAAYRAHPYRRAVPDDPVLWEEGGSRLRDLGGAGPPLLVVPSLVNKPDILDLLPGASLLRGLARRGNRVLLLDWGAPGLDEAGYELEAYIARLGRAALSVGEPCSLLGYCMGGLLALAHAARHQVRSLALLATPWDFGAAPRPHAGLAPWLDGGAAVPVALLQAGFALLDPASVRAKFARFAALGPGSAAARRFVAAEDWLNDGVPLTAAVARDVLEHWYGRNAPSLDSWVVAAETVRAGDLRAPALVVAGEADRLVPAACARPLAAALPGAALLQVPLGHIGLMTGSRCRTLVWNPLAAWLARHAASTI